MDEVKGNSSDKRIFYRFEYNAPIKYKFAKMVAPGKYAVSPWCKGVGANFSGGGAAFYLGKPLPPKTLLFMEIRFPFGEEPLLATAEVVRRQEAEFKGKKVSMVMIKYLLMDPVAQDKMVSFIISRGRSVSQ